MSTPQLRNGPSTAGATLVLTQGRGRWIALALGALIVVPIAIYFGLQATRSGRTGVAGLCAFLAADGVLTCIVFAELARRAGKPLLVVDETGVTTGRLPKVHLTWEQIERVRVFEHDSNGGVIGIVPRSLEAVAAGIFGSTDNAAKYAARLRSFTETKGAPIVVPLRSTALDAAAAATAIRSIARGRTDVTG